MIAFVIFVFLSVFSFLVFSGIFYAFSGFSFNGSKLFDF